MRLRERSQVDYTNRVFVDIDLDSKGPLVTREGASASRMISPGVFDEIEQSDSEDSFGGDKPEAISDDSSNLDDDVPVATKIHTGRLRRRKLKAGRLAEGRGEGDDIAGGTRTKAKKPASKDLLLKYLQPNVSNVEDRPSRVNLGSDSEDAFEGAPPLLQAGRRKRKVVAQPRGNSVPLSSDDDGGDDRPLKRCPMKLSNGSSIARFSSRPARQSVLSYKDHSSSDDEQFEPLGAVSKSQDQLGAFSDAQDEEMQDASDKDLVDFGAYAFKKEDNGTKRKLSTKTLCKEKTANDRTRRLRNLSKPASSKGEESLPGQRRPLREYSIRNLKDASSSDESGPAGLETSKVDAVSKWKPRRWLEGCDGETQHCSEAQDESTSPVLDRLEAEQPVMLNIGVYGIERDEGPAAVAKRIGRVEKILSARKDGDSSLIFTVKEYGKSYRDVVHVNESTLLKHCPQLIRNFLKRLAQLGRVDGHCSDRPDSPAFDPLFTKIDRIIAHEVQKKKKVYLVKWCRLPYTEVTWEKEEKLSGDRLAISRYYQINKVPSPSNSSGKSIQKRFRDGRVLRNYQEEGVTWLDHNFENRTNCVLADEMGLGKTIQSVAMLETLRCKRNLRGPFLVIVPVSTLGHWQREIESLTDMNCIVYSGTQDDRDIIRQYEFNFASNSKALKFNVLLTSFEMLMRDQNKLAKETWQYIIVDEAHRLKSRVSKTTQALRQLKVRKGGLLLLTGTPVQNNTKEIFSLLNLLDPEKFNSEEDFLEKYGEIEDAEQIKDLQENILRPRLLRRMKEDVEKSIPQKEETIVWVELTKDQRLFYKAILENNVASLLKGSSTSNLPNLRNVAMELRKVCNHPFLCDGLEDSLTAKLRSNANDSNASGNLLQNSSGKMILVDKLLPKLKDAGRRVLIFSQFTIMLDLLEDYMIMKGYSYERIDGKIRGSERQAAIDRYSAKDSDIFVFLLSTRAGGLGITLTAADTCIIYDSDWNPQNDLQAMARCHRIGQTKDVKIYRLITRNTYEERLFECSSRKYGLDEAILGNRVGADVNLDHDKHIESLLKHGAYDIMKDGGDEAAAEFNAQDIDQILEQRTQQRQIGGRGNNTFSVATFKTNPEVDAVAESEQDSKCFWQGLMPEACDRTMAEAIAAEVPTDLHPGGLRKRTRGRVNYRENARSLEDSSSDEMDDGMKSKKAGNENDASFSSDLESSEGNGTHINYWSEKELKRLEDRFFALGRDRTEQIREEARLEHRSPEDIDEISNILVELCQSYVGANALLYSTVEDPTSTNAEPRNCTEMGEQPKLQPLVLPASVRKVLESQACKDRIQRNAQRYLQQLHERKVLAEALQIRAFDFMDMPQRSKKLPNWWGLKEDADLLKGAHIHGHKDFKKIRMDSNLSFVNRTGQISESKVRPTHQLYLMCTVSIFQASASAQIRSNVLDLSCCTRQNGEQVQESMPSDQVLGSRLKTLIESLPNGLTDHALKKRASRAEASRKSKMKTDQGKSDEAKKLQPIMNDKNLAEWVTSSIITGGKAESIKDQPISSKAKLKAQARESQKRPVSTLNCLPVLPLEIIKVPTITTEIAQSTLVDECQIQPADPATSPRKPLSQNKQIDLESHKSPQALVLKSKQKAGNVPQENKPPSKKRKLSLSHTAGKSPKESSCRQLSLKSFMKSLPVQ
ncbi:uncharacterized protein [Physcomitrium patens]|uniref:uncharacterized protein isoform X4 n=1 Tax=Physcomitrium patens TaxID=3218 RepID=UPI003CCD1673